MVLGDFHNLSYPIFFINKTMTYLTQLGEFYPNRCFPGIPGQRHGSAYCSAVLHLRRPLHLRAGPRQWVHGRRAGGARLAVTPEGLRPVPKARKVWENVRWNHGDPVFFMEIKLKKFGYDDDWLIVLKINGKGTMSAPTKIKDWGNLT